MWSVTFLWGSILLLSSTAGTPAMLNYAVAIPSQLYHPFSETVCLQLSRKQAVLIHVTVTLQSRAGNETLITQSISQLTFFHCMSFQVPPPLGNPDEVAFIVIRVLEANSEFQKKQKVLIKHAEKKTFIQTDKPVYKRGQTVKLRIVTLDQKFIASNEMHRLVELKDPKGNRIAQWLNVTPVGGIADLSFSLAAEASVGKYIIKMPDRTHTFRVEEYVLPKFSVSIQMPQVVTILEENFHLRVCGMYMYGKTVQGSVKAVVCRKHIRYNWKSSKGKCSICKDYTGETNKDGCFATEVDIKFYHQKRGDNYDFNLEAVAFLKESGTGVEFNITENCKVTFDITTLQFWGTSYYYQQGAPYYGNLELKGANGTHLKNKEVILTVSYGSRKQTKTYVTDDTGMVSFTLETSAWDNSSKVLLEAKAQLEDLSNRNVMVSYGTASLTLRAFYSSSHSSVRIQPVQAMLPCGVVQQVTVHYCILATELGDGAARADFYYLALARGSLMHHGQTTVLLDSPLGQYSGAFNVTLPIDLISPMATLFVYTAFPEGQVAADTFSLKVSKCFRNHAEGLLEEKTRTSLLCPKGTAASDTITFTMPENMVLGSERVYISFLGDILGTALDNIDELLQMSGGCGEQNMVHFAPNVFITQYLEETGQLTPEIKQRAIGYLESGYQQQLLYKHTDGSYSAFEEGSEPGNTWLTALVLKTFSQARDFIHIDEQNIKDAASALIKSQTTSGCFRSVGKLFNNGLMGAVEEGLGLTSAIVTALIRSGMSRSDPVVWKALKCIKDLVNADTGNSSLYSLALAANAFAAAGDKAFRQKILKRLDKAATISDDQIFWSQQSKQEEDSLYWYRASSVDVELTSSILMAHLSKSSLSSDEIRKASQIVSWLIKQQNPYGGFASSQDTVVALEALALYATKTFSKDGPDLQVSLSSEGFNQNIQVDNTNRLLLQTVELPAIPRDYTVRVQGHGCLFLQAILRYHIPPLRSDVTFALSVQTECTAPNATQLSVTIHARYKGNRVSTNMVLIQVELLSGYSPVAGSLEELKKMPLVKKVESEADQVILYLEELTRQPHTYTLMVQQDMRVKDCKPANIKVYDYCMPEETTVISYSAPCE
ncbi:alpha-2-macroglobulin-like protein 1 [Chlamydotis macqueenii]